MSFNYQLFPLRHTVESSQFPVTGYRFSQFVFRFVRRPLAVGLLLLIC